MMSGSGSHAEPAARIGSAGSRGRMTWFPLLLLILALLDLRTELLLLLDHLTFTSLVTALTAHPLAVVVLLAQPSLWRRYGSRRG
jgi:hypothetical protein